MNERKEIEIGLSVLAENTEERGRRIQVEKLSLIHISERDGPQQPVRRRQPPAPGGG